jgi:hypothetical protein
MVVGISTNTGKRFAWRCRSDRRPNMSTNAHSANAGDRKPNDPCKFGMIAGSELAHGEAAVPGPAPGIAFAQSELAQNHQLKKGNDVRPPSASPWESRLARHRRRHLRQHGFRPYLRSCRRHRAGLSQFTNQLVRQFAASVTAGRFQTSRQGARVHRAKIAGRTHNDMRFTRYAFDITVVTAICNPCQMLRQVGSIER